MVCLFYYHMVDGLCMVCVWFVYGGVLLCFVEQPYTPCRPGGYCQLLLSVTESHTTKTRQLTPLLSSAFVSTASGRDDGYHANRCHERNHCVWLQDGASPEVPYAGRTCVGWREGGVCEGEGCESGPHYRPHTLPTLYPTTLQGPVTMVT